MERGGFMLPLFFLFNFIFTIQNDLFLLQNFRVAIQKSLCTTIITRAAHYLSYRLGLVIA